MALNAMQTLAVDLAVNQRKSIFLTGGGGVGKSYTLQHIIQGFKDKDINFAATGSTGIAGLQVNGTTLHYFAGIGISTRLEDAMKLVNKYRAEIQSRWCSLEVLIVDEISMLDPEFLNTLDQVVRRLFGGANKPFGGIQLIFCGDFFQLPPVPPRDGGFHPFQFCFELPTWTTMVPNVIELTEIFRQRDAPFIGALQRGRLGEMTREDTALLRTRLMSREEAFKPDEHGIIPTILMSYKRNVKEENLAFLNRLPPESEQFYDAAIGATDELSDDEEESQKTNKKRPKRRSFNTAGVKKLREEIEEAEPGQKHLKLRIGAQVMLTCNLDPDGGLVNGSRGVVIAFDEGEELKEEPSSSSSKKKQKIERGVKKWPVVRFTNGSIRCIVPFMWKKKQRDVGKAFYTQIPLYLAWTITVHKSQGKTLDSVAVGVDRTFFADGQAYVALSRCSSLGTLRLYALDTSVITANAKVLKFYRAGHKWNLDDDEDHLF